MVGFTRRLLSIAPPLLLAAALVIAFVTMIADHSAEYGRVSLDGDHTIELKQGTTKIFYNGGGGTENSPVSTPFFFQVVPVEGGPPLGTSSSGHLIAATVSDQVGEADSITDLRVPASGTYRVVVARGTPPAGSEITFGIGRFTAVAHKWRLFVTLVIAALFLLVIPKPRRPTTPEAPEGYAAYPGPTPYSG